MEHSLNTCKAALKVWEGMKELDPTLEKEVTRDSVIIAALLHDVCKSDIYYRSVKKRKNSLGQWEDSEGYKVSFKNFPMGHGEKSVILVLCGGIELSDAEMLAIRWHMGAWGRTSIPMRKCATMTLPTSVIPSCQSSIPPTLLPRQ